MLAPESRHVLTDALRPPAGHRVDLAIGTTYSLDLTASLLAPMSFALHEVNSQRDTQLDPIALLDAVRRHAAHTTVFYQAGSLSVPSKYQRIFVHLEKATVPVNAPAAGRLFHPKLWVLRFRSPEDAVRHRLLCLSRNLTFDRSWDTVLQLDEVDDPNDGSGLDSAPVRSFLDSLSGLSVTPPPVQRRQQLEDLSASLDGIRFAVPSPFETGQLLPLGLAEAPDPLNEGADRTIIISPFLDQSFISRVRSRTARCTWISRPETYERVGSAAFDSDELFVLQPQAETDDASLDGSAPQLASELSGLHAKVLVMDRGSRATVLTGSPNATSAAWAGNVEFAVALTGPVTTCGTAALRKDDGKNLGFGQLLSPYEIQSKEPNVPAAEALELEIENWQRQVASNELQLTLKPRGDVWTLTLSAPSVEPLGDTTVTPAALGDGHGRPWGAAEWTDVALSSISPFLRVETRLERDGLTAKRQCLVAAKLLGDLVDRPARLLTDFLSNRRDMLRLLVLLLGDEALGQLLDPLAASSGQHTASSAGALGEDFPLFELMVRALNREPGALQRLARLREELEVDPKLVDLLPDGFDDIWRPVRQVWKEQTA